MVTSPTSLWTFSTSACTSSRFPISHWYENTRFSLLVVCDTSFDINSAVSAFPVSSISHKTTIAPRLANKIAVCRP
jgi:hypothetical protein